MNKDFQIFYQKLLTDEINFPGPNDRLEHAGDFSDDLLSAILEQISKGNEVILSKLVYLIYLVNSPKFAPVLSELLDNYRQGSYMEEVANLVAEIKDPRTVPSIIRALNLDLGPGDCDHHFNRWLVMALDGIGTAEAIEGLRLAAKSPYELIREDAEVCLRRRNLAETDS